MQELIEFRLGDWQLQEPMAAVTNWMMTLFCFYAYFKLRKAQGAFLSWWKYFFLFFAFSSFFGGTGHLFFQYFGIPGKFPNWILGILCGYLAGKGILELMDTSKTKKMLSIFLPIKGVILLGLALSLHLFIFIAIDAILTYIIFCGFIGFRLHKKGIKSMRFMTYGVLICIPSVFIFLLKINPHRWLNKDDLAHLFMLGCLILFYIATKKYEEESKEIAKS